MDKKKMNNKFVIVILAVILICLVGLICYKLFLVEPVEVADYTGNEEVIPTKTTTTRKGQIIDIKNVGDLPSENDSTIKVLGDLTSILPSTSINSGMNSISAEKEGLNVSFECTEFNNETSDCLTAKVSINNLISFTTKTVKRVSGGEKVNTYLNDKYIILVSESDDGKGYIKVYDLTGKVKYENVNLVRSYYLEDEDGSATELPVRFYNNKLYFVSSDNYKSTNKLDFNFIELNTDEVKVNKLSEVSGRI